MAEPKEQPHCLKCDSTNVTVDSTSRWDNEKQEWVHSDSFDTGNCQDCGYESKFFNWKLS